MDLKECHVQFSFTFESLTQRQDSEVSCHRNCYHFADHDDPPQVHHWHHNHQNLYVSHWWEPGFHNWDSWWCSSCGRGCQGWPWGLLLLLLLAAGNWQHGDGDWRAHHERVFALSRKKLLMRVRIAHSCHCCENSQVVVTLWSPKSHVQYPYLLPYFFFKSSSSTSAVATAAATSLLLLTELSLFLLLNTLGSKLAFVNWGAESGKGKSSDRY